MSQTDRDFDAESFLRSLPGRPGVYRMTDAEDRPLYVGKARDLKKRVASYFRDPQQLPPKVRTMMRHMARVDITTTHTEGEALLLESNLIKELAPRYNILLRDDKSYPYIHVTTHQEFPRLAFHRGGRRKKGMFFGPYPSAGAVRQTLNLLQKLFLVRQCEDSFFSNRSRPCLQYQIKRCTAPCVGLVEPARYAEDVRHAVMFLEGKSGAVIDDLARRMEEAAGALEFEQAARYRDQIASLRKVMERQYVDTAGGDLDVVAAAVREGTACVQVFTIRGGQNLGNRAYFPVQVQDEPAAAVLEAFLPQYYLHNRVDRTIPREILLSEDIGDVTALEELLAAQAGHRVVLKSRVRTDRSRWLEMARENALVALGQRLARSDQVGGRLAALAEVLGLPDVPQRIECFDISHTGGELTVASCVVFGPEGPEKAHYRHFNIQDITPGDDYGAMRQALERRYGRVKREEGRMPDVLLIDGGKGQVSSAAAIIEELQLVGVLLVGVAKGPERRPGMETLVLPGGKAPLILRADSPALHLIQHIRDEAHRFAITGHRGRRGKARNTSSLEGLPGVGAKRRQRLLQQFGGLQGIARAGVEDLARVPGISKQLARTIYDAFHSEG